MCIQEDDRRNHERISNQEPRHRTKKIMEEKNANKDAMKNFIGRVKKTQNRNRISEENNIGRFQKAQDI